MTVLMDEGRSARRLAARRRRFAWDGPEAWRAVLDNLPVNVFVSDLDLRLVYISPTARETLRRLRTDVAQEFGVDVDDALGMSMHAFHKDPGRVEAALAQPESFPHRASFSFGDLELLGTSTGVYDADGQLVGYIGVLDDITDQQHMVDELATTSTKLASSANDFSSMANDLANASEQANRQSGAVSGGTRQLSAGMADLTRATTDIAAATRRVVNSAEVAARTVAALHESSSQIGDVTELIVSIAEQTRLLALNATIEATHAGAAGSGFAVVASEVKSLAQRAQTATGQITDTIGRLQCGINGVGESITEIVNGMGDVRASQQGIAETVEQQSGNTRELAVLADDVASMVDAVTQSTVVTHRSVSELAEQADTLDRLVDVVDQRNHSA